MPSLTDRAWSPYLAGIVIGLLQIPAFLVLDTALGTSSSYVTLGDSVAAWFDPAVTRIDYAARHLSGAKNWWQVAVVLGITLGAYLSSRRSGTRRTGVSPAWARAMGSAGQANRFVLAFLGGFVMLAGARIADGCTTGHGISGMAQLAVGSIVAVCAMFAGGIATAFLFRRV